MKTVKRVNEWTSDRERVKSASWTGRNPFAWYKSNKCPSVLCQRVVIWAGLSRRHRGRGRCHSLFFSLPFCLFNGNYIVNNYTIRICCVYCVIKQKRRQIIPINGIASEESYFKRDSPVCLFVNASKNWTSFFSCRWKMSMVDRWRRTTLTTRVACQLSNGNARTLFISKWMFWTSTSAQLS